MFICKECGEKYKVKPDFCDCGNDDFSEIYETLPDDDSVKKRLNSDKKDLFSWFVFVLCLFLSLLVLLFFPKIDETKVTNTQSKPTNIVKTTNPNIPDVETFWINPATGVLEPAEHVSPVEQIKEVFKPKQDTVKKNPAAQNKPKQTQSNTIQKPKPKNEVSKPSASNASQQKNTTQTANNNTSQNQVKNSQPVSNMYEFVNYKNKLRNTLLSNLRLSTVEGSGKCGVEFAIASDGKLINRGFIYQSENKTVNDAVYKMLMRTPRFLPPPEAYKGEMIKMVFQLNNTSYTIDYMN